MKKAKKDKMFWARLIAVILIAAVVGTYTITFAAYLF